MGNIMWKVGEQLNGPKSSYMFLKSYFKKFMNIQEAMFAVALDVRNRPIGKAWIVSLGTVNAVQTFPRDVFREAVKRNAVSVIIAHNHPSGVLTPSKRDIDLTRKLKEAGEILGIVLLDHLIVSCAGFMNIEVKDV